MTIQLFDLAGAACNIEPGRLKRFSFDSLTSLLRVTIDDCRLDESLKKTSQKSNPVLTTLDCIVTSFDCNGDEI